mmetsp:Transcript_20060/g.63060  ORF Transcript_20060/g.63060 Transcript_20060/m.63060 type:complete len:97 (-) Transcript_20060:22-312(-)
MLQKLTLLALLPLFCLLAFARAESGAVELENGRSLKRKSGKFRFNITIDEGEAEEVIEELELLDDDNVVAQRLVKFLNKTLQAEEDEEDSEGRLLK